MRKCALAAVLLAAMSFGSVCMAANSYYVYADWSTGIPGNVVGVGGYNDTHGYLGTPGAQYLFFVVGPGYEGPRGSHVGYCFRVDTPGDANRHPSNPLDPGPMVPRTFTLVGSHPMVEFPDGYPYQGHRNDFQVDDSGIYYGAQWGGIFQWDLNWNPIGWVVPVSAGPSAQTLGRNPTTGDWWVADDARNVYRWSADSGAWIFQFVHMDLAGSHSDGLEVVGNSLFISDMTSDLIIQYRLDGAGNVIDPPGTPYNVFTYSNPASVEGMGFGPNQHLWVAGWSSGTIYELGGGDIQGWMTQIPGQTILEGQTFSTFDLDNYASGKPPVVFAWSGTSHLTIAVDGSNVVRTTYPAGWVGSETVTLTANDSLGWEQSTEITFEVRARAILINYQGKLTDKTGKPLDTTLPVTFRIYDSGGTSLWEETQTVTVAKGIFNVLLGTATTLPDSTFNEPVRYLGVIVSGQEMLPRQRIATAPYAAHALNTDKVGGFDADQFVKKSGDMMTGSLDVRGDFRAGSHSLVYNDLTGFVGIGNESPAYSLDVAGTVRANSYLGDGSSLLGVNAALLDGLDSTALALSGHTHANVDADTLDGLHSSAFARASHDHWGESWTGKGPGLALSTVSGNAFAAVTSDTYESWAGYFEGPSHWGGAVKGSSMSGIGIFGLHTDLSLVNPAVYGKNEGAGIGVLGDAIGANAGVRGRAQSGAGVEGTSSTGPGGKFSSASGNALEATGNALVTGTLTASNLAYSTARTRYVAVSGDSFRPGADVTFQAGGGMGGAYITAGGGSMTAPVQLPQGAVVTGFTVFFNDTSAADMTVTLYRLWYTGAYASLAIVTSSGTGGYSNGADTTISNATIDNTQGGYFVNAFCTNWSSSIKIMGALITYTVNQPD